MTRADRRFGSSKGYRATAQPARADGRRRAIEDRQQRAAPLALTVAMNSRFDSGGFIEDKITWTGDKVRDRATT